MTTSCANWWSGTYGAKGSARGAARGRSPQPFGDDGFDLRSDDRPTGPPVVIELVGRRTMVVMDDVKQAATAATVLSEAQRAELLWLVSDWRLVGDPQDE
jgi:hypothetical protein